MFDALFANAPHDRLTKRLQLFFAGGELPPEDLFCRWLLHFETDLKRDVYSDDFWRATGGTDSGARVRELYHRSDARDPTNAMLDVDVRTYLPDDLLVKLDMTTMRHSLEGRCPYLDHELFEFVASLPGDMKLRRLTTKWIVRDALREHELVEVAGKQAIRTEEERVIAPSGLTQSLQHVRPHRSVALFILVEPLWSNL